MDESQYIAMERGQLCSPIAGELPALPKCFNRLSLIIY